MLNKKRCKSSLKPRTYKLKKFSNVELFDKRQKEISGMNFKKYKNQIPLRTKIMMNKLKNLKKDSFPLLSKVSNYYLNSESNSKKHSAFIRPFSLYKKKSNNYCEYPSESYISNLTTTHNYQNSSYKTHKKFYTESFKEIDLDAISFNENEKVDCSKKGNADFLKTIVKILKSEKEKNIESNVELKTKEINLIQEVDREHINKAKEYNLMRYIVRGKKERAVRIKENNSVKHECLDDKIKSYKYYEKLFSYKFYIIMLDYVKFLNKRKDIEKSRSFELFSKTLAYKDEITRLNNKIKKMELVKGNLLKWIYLQIQIKEKLLAIPNYYKSIFENNDNINKNDKNNKNEKQLNNSKSKKTDEYIFENDEEKLNKIIYYRTHLVFETPEELYENISLYENAVIILLQNYNYENKILLNEKKILNQLSTKKNKLNEIFEEKFRNEEKELNNLKYENFIKLNWITSLKNIIRFNSNITVKVANSTKNNFNTSDDKENLNLRKLSKKITHLFDICSFKKFSSLTLRRLNNLPETSKLLFMLKHIESIFDYLLNFLKDYKNKKSNEEIEIINKAITENEKRNKIIKFKSAKKTRVKKFQKLKDKVERRSDKIYFLPYKKVEYRKYDLFSAKKRIKKIQQENNSILPTFEDFIFQDSDDLKNKNKETEKCISNIIPKRIQRGKNPSNLKLNN